jgi:hypothetical protein
MGCKRLFAWLVLTGPMFAGQAPLLPAMVVFWLSVQRLTPLFMIKLVAPLQPTQ